LCAPSAKEQHACSEYAPLKRRSTIILHGSIRYIPEDNSEHNIEVLSRKPPAGTEKNHENFSQELNQGPPEYEAGVLTTRP
jgi:hypothetical protein